MCKIFNKNNYVNYICLEKETEHTRTTVTPDIGNMRDNVKDAIM